MNIITFIHRGAEGVYHALARFRAGHKCVVFAWEDDGFREFDFPGERLLQASGGGEYRGHRLLGKMHAAVRLAASLDGPTAISEYDAVILKPVEAEDGVLHGSRLFRSRDITVDGFLAPRFIHAPWITTQAGWGRILGEMDEMRKGDGYDPDEQGYPDRWLSLAALNAGMTLTPTGWSENTLEISQHAAILSKLPDCQTLHGIKHRGTIEILCNTTSPT